MSRTTEPSGVASLSAPSCEVASVSRGGTVTRMPSSRSAISASELSISSSRSQARPIWIASPGRSSTSGRR
ncbi:MAG: hypothetical protein M5U13_01525 [Thermoanaerobaculia bacterium]|nr:hypothetical protein [Thermoanaerobaculia bacterium]